MVVMGLAILFNALGDYTLIFGHFGFPKLGLIGAGFAIRHVEEWAPNAGELAAHPDWAEELNRPMFLLISAER